MAGDFKSWLIVSIAEYFWTVGQFTNLQIRIFTMKSFEPDLMQITKLLKYFWFYWFLFGNFKWFRQYKLNLNMTHYPKVWRVKIFTIKASKSCFKPDIKRTSTKSVFRWACWVYWLRHLRYAGGLQVKSFTNAEQFRFHRFDISHKNWHFDDRFKRDSLTQSDAKSNSLRPANRVIASPTVLHMFLCRREIDFLLRNPSD